MSPSASRCLDVYVNGCGLSMAANRSCVLDVVVDAARDLHGVIADDARCAISSQEAAIAASSQDAGNTMRKLPGGGPGRLEPRMASDLGGGLHGGHEQKDPEEMQMGDERVE
eukprot:5658295-Pyramimonas_sp.AAC.1